jgi:hypothetical protein
MGKKYYPANRISAKTVIMNRKGIPAAVAVNTLAGTRQERAT